MSPQYAICVKHSDSQMWRPALACPPQYDTAPLAEALTPFVAAFRAARERYARERFDAMPGEWPMDTLVFTMEDFRLAEAALSKLSQQQGSDATGSPQAHSPQDDTMKGIDT